MEKTAVAAPASATATTQKRNEKYIEKNVKLILKQMGLFFVFGFYVYMWKGYQFGSTISKIKPTPFLLLIFFRQQTNIHNGNSNSSISSISRSSTTSTNYSIIDSEIKILFVSAMVSIYLILFYVLYFFLFQCKQLSAMQGNPINVISLYCPCPFPPILLWLLILKFFSFRWEEDV